MRTASGESETLQISQETTDKHVVVQGGPLNFARLPTECRIIILEHLLCLFNYFKVYFGRLVFLLHTVGRRYFFS